MTATTEQLIRLLLAALSDPVRCAKAVADFQSIVWAGLDPDVPAGVATVLQDLAYDLDFFEPNARFRSEDESLYGHRQLEAEIRQALVRLESAGVQIPD